MRILLSTAATDALVDVGTNRQGARIPENTPPAVVDELQRQGLIGDGAGLTRRGTITRERIVNTMMDMLF